MRKEYDEDLRGDAEYKQLFSANASGRSPAAAGNRREAVAAINRTA
jgi:hypothetical protein